MKIPEPSFTLKEPNSKSESLINMKLYINYKRITLSSGVKIYPKAWNNSDGCIITDKKELRRLEIEYPGVSRNFQKIETTIANYTAAYRKAVARLDMLGEEWDEKTLKSQIEKELGKGTQVKKKLTLTEFIDSFIKEIENGKRLTSKGKPFSKGTIKNYKGFQEQFKAFLKEEHKQIDFNDVTIEFRDKFVGYFFKKDYSPNTIWRHIKHIKSIMNVAFEDGLHSNMDFQKRKFMIPQVETTEIYLTENELDKILGLDLVDRPHLDLARDVFLVGCYTAQRYSDFSRISKEQVTVTPDGNKVIALTQLKTGTPVIIPVSKKLDKILRKYDYTLPKTHEQKVNKYIKDIVEEAKIDKLESDDVFLKGKRSIVTKPKHKLVKTHTARRSGATNMFLAKVPVISIMKMTGHKTEREFLKYIRITNQENADNLANHPYFS